MVAAMRGGRLPLGREVRRLLIDIHLFPAVRAPGKWGQCCQSRDGPWRMRRKGKEPPPGRGEVVLAVAAVVRTSA